jgi:hypothetical protein
MYHLQCWKHSLATFVGRVIHLFCNQLKIQVGSHIVVEITFYNFDSSSLLAMGCFLEAVIGCLETLSKTFLSLSHISCNPTNG